MEKDAFPLILILTRSHGSLELLNVIEGKSTPGEVLLQLIHSHDAFEQQRQRDAKEETMREVRENLKRQQEDEYHQSLQADKAKEDARFAEERRQQEERTAAEKSKQERSVSRSIVGKTSTSCAFNCRRNKNGAKLACHKNPTKQKTTSLDLKFVCQMTKAF